MTIPGPRTSGWATSVGEILEGLQEDQPVQPALSARVLLADGREVQAGAMLLEFINVLISDGLHGQRARVEVTADLLTAEEAARRLEVSRPTVYAWQDAGLLGRVGRGNRRLVPSGDVDALRVAQQARQHADRLAEESLTAEPVLSETAYRQALHEARLSGGSAVVAKVRRRQRAAQIAAQAAHARSALSPQSELGVPVRPLADDQDDR